MQHGRFHIAGEWVPSWRITVFRPGDDPFREMAEALPGQIAAELSIPERMQVIGSWKHHLPAGGESFRNALAALTGAQGKSGERILLVVDQFEELFTLTADKEVRRNYINGLLAAAQLSVALPVHLLLILRADFYGNCLDHADLSRTLESTIYNVARMPPEVLRENIEKRLALAAARAEPGLLDSLLADVGEV